MLVIGGGPAGLATAAMLRARGVRFRLIDREGAIGGAYARMDPDIVMTSPAKLVGLPGLALSAAGPYATAREYHAYLRDYARAHELAPEAGEVERIAPLADGYRVTLRGGEAIETAAVVVATGMFDFPYSPDLPGAPSVEVIHARDWRNPLATAGKRVVVVGGASSGVEIAEVCAARGCAVTLAARKVSIGPAKVLGVDPAFALFPVLARTRPRKFCDGEVTVPGVDRGFKALCKRGAIAVCREPVRIDGARVAFADGATTDADLVVLATGYRHAAPFLPLDLARSKGASPRCEHGESVSHRRLYFVGVPCARSAASQYLYGIARDAAAVADRLA
jgi:putative flavoprotein involved in K+ transport